MQQHPARASFLTACLLVFFILFAGESAGALLTVHARTAVDLELVGYDGLAEISLARAKVPAGRSATIDTPYSGLGVLVFAGGQSYPVILGDESFTLHIEDAAVPPSFTGSKANEYFYARLIGKEKTTGPGSDDFARLMLRAKQLLESTQSTRTIDELSAKKKEIQEFVRDNYDKLKHSDMVRRLVAQFFMMHEYIDYHVEGAPATDIKSRYEQAVLDGVAGWLESLRPHIPAHAILNYCVSLYYQRSMITLAAVIAEKFPAIAYCPGIEKEGWKLPAGVLVTDAGKNREMQLKTIEGEKIIAFVSDDCPVSMVETVIKARELTDRKKGVRMIVAPMQQLSETHLSMNRMVSNGNILFINDEQWRKENLAEKIRLPLFVPLGEDQLLPERTATE